jgi:DNA polymerase I-like protein with 3'-5' exonuclease and polymerase domains
MKLKREFAKVFCHATNYVGSARTIAGHVGRTVHEVDRAQRIWFGAHPGVKRWHESVSEQISKRRFVENKFGYRWYIFDRIDAILPEAVAWIPQSTVSIVINRIWLNIYKHLPEVQVLLQVHDSLAGQGPTHRREHWLAEIERLSQIVIPYPDPLIIPTSVSTSEVSWGDCA